MNWIQSAAKKFNEKRIGRLIARKSMIDPVRSGNLLRLAQLIEEEKIPGDVVECGVYRGGSAATMARVATHSPLNRTVWLFDSFQGMPPATEVDGTGAQDWVGALVYDARKVEKLLKRTGANMSRVRIVEGFFADTFPTVDIPQIALLNVDSDWYESVKICFEKFYDAVVPGGFVSIDDYGTWPGCRLAVDEFFKTRSLTHKIIAVDRTASWFRKD
ncbi:MAG: TylF/MycF/NovP-related O-methyltransferase [Candidatus Acidiferrum sp.]